MKVSLSWLNEYVPVEIDINKLVDALTMVGLEVESLSDRYEYIDTFFVGRIVEMSPHPNADQLKICNVDLGDRLIRVVCGAPNADKDLIVPVALPGTLLLDGTTIEKSVIRGEVSEGMLCSEAELGLGSDRSGLMPLNPSLSPGLSLSKALDLSDMVMAIDLTPNRPDCLSFIGVAREVAAIQGVSVNYPEIKFATRPKGDITSHAAVSIESPDHCPRYAARLIEGITVSPSPFWLQDRLLSVGLRPINNIVDITNFVMLETGQPLHAFDFDSLAEHRIVVRTAKDGEVFTTLDGKEHALSKDMLMICDGENPVAIAGVMGGLNSEIKETTKQVLIESAHFSAVSIRKTSKRLGINTDASHRFERGVNPEGTVTALNRAAQLMVEIGKGTLIDGTIDEYPGLKHRKVIDLSVQKANRLLGLDLDQHKVKALLESIEFNVSVDNNDRLKVIPPPYRVDIKRPVDLIEEIARLYGYNRIPTTFPLITPQSEPPEPALILRKKIKKLMVGFGFSEAVNYSFTSSDACNQLKLPPDDPRRRTVTILNPLREDQTEMRTVMLPSLLGSMHHNLSQQANNFKLFEIGKIFLGNGPDNLPEEIEFLTALWTGTRIDQTWHDTGTSCDFYDIKGAVEGLLMVLDVGPVEFTKIPLDKCYYTRPGYTAGIEIGEAEIGMVGELHPEVLKNFDLKQTAYFFELNLDILMPLVPSTKQAKPLPKYPVVSRDVTLIIDKKMEAQKILESIRNIDEKLIESVHLFDVFEGESVQRGKKSISFRIIYRSADRTLADDEINQLHKTIADEIIRLFDAALPT